MSTQRNSVTQTASDGPQRPSTSEMLDELDHAASGIGLATVTFLGAIPGFLPAAAMTLLLGAIVLIPMVIVGAAVAVPWLAFRIIVRVVRVGSGRAPARTEPAPSRAASAARDHTLLPGDTSTAS